MTINIEECNHIFDILDEQKGLLKCVECGELYWITVQDTRIRDNHG